MDSYAKPIIAAAEAVAIKTGDTTETLNLLRQLPIDDFGVLMLSLPAARYPGLSRLLPRMAATAIQQSWTGSDGFTLLRQTLTFVRVLSHTYANIVGSGLDTKKILDFGCGWGRIIRLMYYFSDPAQIYGCDPWDKSIEICRADGVLGQLAMSDYLPEKLPFGDQTFDLIYAFSVFTHLSERATTAALKVLSDAMDARSMLAITIRPVEYWRFHQGLSPSEVTKLEHAHMSNGFAFKPHLRDAINGDITYGDTSISFDYLKKNFPDLKLRKFERTLDDPYQIICFLTK